MLAKKDPAVATAISVICMILGSPAIGYVYLGKMKKGAIYLLANWALTFISLVVYIAIGIFTGGAGFVCLPVFFLLPLILSVMIVYDVYLTAKGEAPKLPSF